MDTITKDMDKMKVKDASEKARRGSKMTEKEVQKSRRRLSLIASGQSGELAYQLDGLGEAKTPTSAAAGEGSKDAICTNHAIISHVGFVPFNNSKVNQDRPLFITSYRGDPNQALFGVFDGHGSLGHLVSQDTIDKLPKKVDKHLGKESDIATALKKAFVEYNDCLKANKQIEEMFSGTTAVACYIKDKTIYCANAGDSRAVLATCGEDGSFKAEDLSIDQKPERADEAKRIIACNGRVEACKDNRGNPIGPLRVWLKTQSVPGLAMTRSFGDGMAQTVGVIPEPEVIERTLTGNDKFMIIASDGVWEFITSQEAVDMVAECKGDGPKACAKLLKISTERWNAEEDVVDDITAVVVYF